MSDELQRLRDQNARLKERLAAAERDRETLRAECKGMITADKADSIKQANKRLREKLIRVESECRHLRGRK